MLKSSDPISKWFIIPLALIAMAGCSSLLPSHSSPVFDLTEQCWDCAAVKGQIDSDEYAQENLIKDLYIAKNAVIKTDSGVEIDAQEVALNTRTGVFVTPLMTGRIMRNKVEIAIAKGSLLNIKAGRAEGDEKGYRMEGGASITMGEATVSAEKIELRYF